MKQILSVSTVYFIIFPLSTVFQDKMKIIDNSNSHESPRNDESVGGMIFEIADVEQANNKKNRGNVNNIKKFYLLMWKNYLLQWRHKFQTLIQILIPVLFIANLVLVRVLFEPETQPNNTSFNSFSIDKITLR